MFRQRKEELELEVAELQKKIDEQELERENFRSSILDKFILSAEDEKLIKESKTIEELIKIRAKLEMSLRMKETTGSAPTVSTPVSSKQKEFEKAYRDMFYSAESFGDEEQVEKYYKKHNKIMEPEDTMDTKLKEDLGKLFKITSIDDLFK